MPNRAAETQANRGNLMNRNKHNFVLWIAAIVMGLMGFSTLAETSDNQNPAYKLTRPIKSAIDSAVLNTEANILKRGGGIDRDRSGNRDRDRSGGRDRTRPPRQPRDPGRTRPPRPPRDPDRTRPPRPPRDNDSARPRPPRPPRDNDSWRPPRRPRPVPPRRPAPPRRWDDDDDDHWRRPLPPTRPLPPRRPLPPAPPRTPDRVSHCDWTHGADSCSLIRFRYERPHNAFNLSFSSGLSTNRARSLVLVSRYNSHSEKFAVAGMREIRVEYRNGQVQNIVLEAKDRYPGNISSNGTLYLSRGGSMRIPLWRDRVVRNVYIRADSWIGPGIDAYVGVLLD